MCRTIGVVAAAKAALVVFVLASGYAASSCGGDSTGSSENLCALLGLSGRQPSLNFDCGGSATSTISNITHDRFGRVVA
jgi:hypothetical protein